ncbi:unnamed protein product [Moneuplotes crassus]|uniref:Uncharacterized protein n=2 Tax=Euplotes crassus TaxID=5936 RepID=A0AAD1UFJ0_EUPCR|nr:unnamed protein product [Moneuplotes crassus]
MQKEHKTPNVHPTRKLNTNGKRREDQISSREYSSDGVRESKNKKAIKYFCSQCASLLNPNAPIGYKAPMKPSSSKSGQLNKNVTDYDSEIDVRNKQIRRLENRVLDQAFTIKELKKNVEVEDSMKAMENEIEEREKIISEKEKKIILLQDQVNELNELQNKTGSNFHKKEGELNLVQAENEDLSLRNQQLLAQVKELKNRLSKAEEKILEKEEDWSIKYHSVAKKISELEQHNSNNIHATKKMTEESKASEKAKEEQEEKMKQLEFQLQKIQGELNEANDLKKIMKKKLVKKNKGEEETAAEIEKLKSDLRNAMNKIKHLKSTKLADLELKVSEKESEIEILKQMIRSLKIEISGKQTDIKRLSKKVNRLDQANDMRHDFIQNHFKKTIKAQKKKGRVSQNHSMLTENDQIVLPPLNNQISNQGFSSSQETKTPLKKRRKVS